VSSNPQSGKITIGVRVTPEEFEALDTHTKKHGISKTELIRAYLRSLPEYKPKKVTGD
jgi:hypothetical protein